MLDTTTGSATVTPITSSDDEDTRPTTTSTAGQKRDHEGEKRKSSRTKTTRINAAQKQACLDFFNGHVDVFNRNSSLPRHGGMAEFDDFLCQQRLKRSQAVTQFDNWKRQKFEFHGEVFNFDSEDLRKRLRTKMPVHKDLICNTVDNLVSDANGSGKMIVRFPETTAFYKFIKSNETSPFFKILRDFLDGYVDLLVELMPNKAKLCDNAEDTFLQRREQIVDEKFEDFFTEIKSFEFPDDMTELEKRFNEKRWKTLFYDLEDKLYYYWCRARFNVELPPVQIAQDDKVISEFARPMLYFTSGVLLRKIASESKTTFNSRKGISEFMCENHIITKEAANCLPTAICESRRKKPVYASSEFYDFIAMVESTFVINATLEMMMAYCDGSLFDKIKDRLIDDKTIFDGFKLKLRLDDFDDVEIRKVFTEILTIYRNIRSRWFINNVNGQQKKTGKYEQSTREYVKETAAVAAAKEEAKAEITEKLRLKATAEENHDTTLASEFEAAVDTGNMYLEAIENIDSIEQA